MDIREYFDPNKCRSRACYDTTRYRGTRDLSELLYTYQHATAIRRTIEFKHCGSLNRSIEQVVVVVLASRFPSPSPPRVSTPPPILQTHTIHLNHRNTQHKPITIGFHQPSSRPPTNKRHQYGRAPTTRCARRRLHSPRAASSSSIRRRRSSSP